MIRLPPNVVSRFGEADALLKSGRTQEAISLLRALVVEAPSLVDVRLQLAAALKFAGDIEGAIETLREASTTDHGMLGNKAAVELAYLLVEAERAPEALALIASPASRPGAGLSLLTAYGFVLKANRQIDAAIVIYARAVAIAPASAVAEHNLAAVLGDAQRYAESEAAARRALGKGLDAPETLLVGARALLGMGDFIGAEEAYLAAIDRRPAYEEAHSDLAQLIWRRTEEISAAAAPLDLALRRQPGESNLSRVKAKLLDCSGDREGAYAVLADALSRPGADPAVHVDAALLLAWTNPTHALEHALEAFAWAPEDGTVLTALCQANLAAGRPDAAAVLAQSLRNRWPLDQRAISLAATAWRMLGDPRYAELYDYSELVKVRPVDTPVGWSSLADYLADFAAYLHDKSRLPGHPIGQSLRHGAQTHQSLTNDPEPVVKAFFQAIDTPIRQYVEGIRRRRDDLGRRASIGYRYDGAWSALLRPGGYHVDHIHPMGWISSACHIEVPAAVERGPEGWLTFGAPGIPTDPPLEPEYYLKPQVGHLVLFPSYMWHGTVPFDDSKQRLTVAFDLLPQ